MNQRRLFEQIWNERERVSEVSGKPLYPKSHYKWHWQFAHILPKGSFPKYRLRKDNIMLMLPSEHERQEQYELFQQRKIELTSEYYNNLF